MLTALREWSQKRTLRAALHSVVVSNAVAGSASLVTVARRQPQGWPNGCGQNSCMPAGAPPRCRWSTTLARCARLGLSGFGVLVAANWCGDWVTARWSSYSNCGGKNGLISPSGRKGGADSCQVPARRIDSGGSGRLDHSPVSPRTNARVTSRLRLDTRDRDCARRPWRVRRFAWR